MSAVISWVRAAALWLVRFEIVLLSLIYIYFVVTDQVPLAAFGLIALIWLARWLTTGMLTSKTPLDLPILILLAWLPVSLSVSIYAWQSLPKIYGVILGAAFFYAIVNAIATRRDLAWAIFWLVVICAAISLAGLVGTDWAQGKIVSASFVYDRLPRFIQGIPRSIGGGFARNGVGGTLTFVVPLLAALFLAPKESDADGHGSAQVEKVYPRLSAFVRVQFRWFVVLSLSLSLITLALTQSRGGILGTLVGLLAVAVWRERRLAWLLVAGALALIVLIALGYSNTLVDLLLRIDARNGTLTSRLEVWQRGVMMVQDFPFTGIGIGTFNSIAHMLYPLFLIAPDEVVAHTHNNLLEVAVDVGIPGLIAYVALLTGFVVCAVRAYRSAVDDGVRALIAGVGFGMLAHQTFGLTDAFILGTKPGIVMWVFLAFAAVSYARRAAWKTSPPFPSPIRGGDRGEL